MNNPDFRLQLLTGAQTFVSKKDALEYINENLTPIVLKSEPATFFYQDENGDMRMLLAIGGERKNKIYFIDEFELRQIAESALEISEKNADDIVTLFERLTSTIKAAGLTLNEKFIEDSVFYRPEKSDEIIADAETLGEAIHLLAQFVQEYANSNKFEVETTNTIKMVMKEDESGKTLKSKVRFSDHGSTDELSFNDNILGSYDDGIFACVNMEYDQVNNKLIFTKSGKKNGVFVDDAIVKEFELGKHTEYVADNTNHDITLVIDNDTKSVSADVKISEADNNILSHKDGMLYVNGIANNITYNDTTVADELDTLGLSIADLVKNTVLNGVKTDTANVTITKDANGCNNIATDVLLSNDASLIITDGGLSVNLEVSIDANRNMLIIKLGNTVKEYELPGVNIIDNIKYDSANHDITIVFNNGQTITIPVKDIIQEYKFVNSVTSPIKFVTKPNDDGSKDVSANLNLRSTDNIIALDENGYLYASKSELNNYADSVVAAEKADRIEKDNMLTAELTLTNADVLKNAKDIETLKDVTKANVEALHDEIVGETTRATLAEKDLADRIETTNHLLNDVRDALTNETTDRKAQDEALVLDITKNAEAISTLQNDLKDTNHNLESEISDRENADNQILHAIDDVKSDLSSTKEELTKNINDVDNKLTKEINDTKEGLTKDIQDVKDALESAKESLSEDIEDALAEAKEYTDKETERAEGVEKVLTDKLTEEIARAIAKDEEHDAALAKKIEKVEIEKNSESDLQYFLLVDDKKVGEINIPKDQFLKDVKYDAGNKQLIFTFIVTDGRDEIVEVDVSDLVDTYKAGDGLKLDENNVFSLEISEASESFLTVDENGLKLSGINEALALKANATDVYTKSEVDTTTDALQSDIDTVSSDLASTVEDVKANTNAIKLLNGFAEEEGSVKYYVKQAKDELSDAISNEVDRAKEVEKEFKSQLDTINSEYAIPGSLVKVLEDAKAYTDATKAELEGNVSDTLDKANEYTDTIKTELENKFTETVNDTKSYLESEISKTLDSANDYTDTVKTELESKVDNALSDAKSYTDDTKSELQGEIDTKVSEVELVQGDTSLIYHLYVDGKKQGTINIPKDQFLKSAEYDPKTHILTFVFATTEGDTFTNIDISDLIDTYEAGDGLQLEDNIFSIHIDNESEKYLKVTDEGLILTGLDEKFNAKADADSVYTKVEADGKFLTEHQDISGLATKEELNELGSTVSGIDEVVETVSKSVSDEVQRATSKENELEEKITENTNKLTTLNGGVDVEGSVKKAANDALVASKEYTDSKISTIVDTTYTAGNGLYLSPANEFSVKRHEDCEEYLTVTEGGVKLSGIKAALAVKADSSNVYTKDEADNKFLTTHQDISNLATKNEVEAVKAIADATSEKVDDVEDRVDDIVFGIDNTDTTTLTMKVVDNNKVLVSDVRVSNIDGNILKANGNGLYANVTLNYDEITNKLLFNNGLGEVKEIQLSEHTLVTDAYYDSEHKNIVIVVTTASGSDTIELSVGDLIKEFDVVNTDENPIKLTKGVNEEGLPTIAASVEVSNEPHNLILKKNGTLYASNRASDLTAINKNGEEETVQESLSKLNNDITDISKDIDIIEINMETVKADVKDVKDSMTLLNNEMARLEEKTDNAVETVKELSDKVTVLESKVDDNSDKIAALEKRVETAEENISELKAIIGDYPTDKDTVAERLEAIETAIMNLFDAGIYELISQI